MKRQIYLHNHNRLTAKANSREITPSANKRESTKHQLSIGTDSTLNLRCTNMESKDFKEGKPKEVELAVEQLSPKNPEYKVQILILQPDD